MKNKNLTTNADAQEAKAQHTKGEWLYSDNKDLQVREEFTCGEIHTASKIIAHVSVNKFGMLKKEAEANAQRIVKCVNGFDKLSKENELLKIQLEQAKLIIDNL